jgi:hypothetical protein
MAARVKAAGRDPAVHSQAVLDLRVDVLEPRRRVDDSSGVSFEVITPFETASSAADWTMASTPAIDGVAPEVYFPSTENRLCVPQRVMLLRARKVVVVLPPVSSTSELPGNTCANSIPSV